MPNRALPRQRKPTACEGALYVLVRCRSRRRGQWPASTLLWWCQSLARRLGHIERTTKTDPLTGLGSGHWLETERWPAALRSGRPLGVVYLDLDHLKARNDQHGHALGDLYIQEAANALRQATRRGVDEVFRLYTAGDEFLVILHGPLEPARLAQTLVERLRNYGVSASMGLAYSTETGYLPVRVELRQAAERACRQAKKLGGDQRRRGDCRQPEPARWRTDWETEAAEDSETSDNIPEPIIDVEPMAGRIPVSVRPLTAARRHLGGAMTIEQAISRYLEARKTQGLHLSCGRDARQGAAHGVRVCAPSSTSPS